MTNLGLLAWLHRQHAILPLRMESVAKFFCASANMIFLIGIFVHFPGIVRLSWKPFFKKAPTAKNTFTLAGLEQTTEDRLPSLFLSISQIFDQYSSSSALALSLAKPSSTTSSWEKFVLQDEMETVALSIPSKVKTSLEGAEAETTLGVRS
jgi:hypothetical protein